MTNVSFYHF
jgi:hypothetical protein